MNASALSSTGTTLMSNSSRPVRPSSASSSRKGSSGKVRPDRPNSATTTSSSTALGSSLGPRVLQVAGRRPQEEKLSKHPPINVWNYIPEPPKYTWAERWGTKMSDDKRCSVPADLHDTFQTMWCDSVKGGQRFLCILEVCHNCEDHLGTTKHKAALYQQYSKMAAALVEREFPFMHFVQLHQCRHYLTRMEKLRRVGAFELYVVYPATPGNSSSCQTMLIHSKLSSLKWPCQGNLSLKLKLALPPIVTRIKEVVSSASEWSQAEGAAIMREANAWGLGSWEALGGLAERVSAASHTIEQGQSAMQRSDKEGLRQALQHGAEMQLQDEAMQDWREDLKRKNMAVFNVKIQARRFQRNAAFAVAVRKLQAAMTKPLRPKALQAAIESAQAADLPEEDVQGAVALLRPANDAMETLTEALASKNLEELGHSIDELDELGVQCEDLDQARYQIEELANRTRRSAELKDLVDLQAALAGWEIDMDPSSTLSGPTVSSNDFQAILKADAVREKLQGLVEEAEKRFQAQRWDALKSAVERLTDVHVEESLWEKWKSSLEREKNFTVLKAVSGASWELKKLLYTSRLNAALGASRISIQQLEEAANAAEAHKVDESAVNKARAEASAVKQRWQTAQEAIARRAVDTAEVMLWKLKGGRIRMDDWRRDGPLREMVDAVRDAEAAQDWQAMQKAIEGWHEDKPGTSHDAFQVEDSPTRNLRIAAQRVNELRLMELRQEVNETLNGIKDPASQLSQAEVRAELQRAAHIIREMLKLGWELTPAKSARLLAMLGKAQSDGGREASIARLSNAALQMMEGSPRFVFLWDQSVAELGAEFKPAIATIARGLHEHSRGALWACIAYGPAEVVQEPTRDLEHFLSSVEAHPCSAGSAALAKAFRAAKDLFKLDQKEEHPADEQRVIIHITRGSPEGSKEAHKAFRVLQELGVMVVSIGVGKDAKVESLMKSASAGLVFKVETSSLVSFFQDAFKDVTRVLKASKSKGPDEILQLLENSS